MLSLLIATSCKPHSKDENSLCALLATAAKVGDIELLNEALNHALLAGSKGWALYKAVYSGRTEVALRLLRAGASTDRGTCMTVYGCRESRWCPGDVTENWYQATCPLVIAVRNRNYNLVRALVDHDAPINSLHSYQESPLRLAVDMNDQTLIRDMIHAGALLRTKAKDPGFASNNSLVAIAVKARNLSLAQVLVHAGADINGRNYKSGPPLKEAAKNHNMDMIE